MTRITRDFGVQSYCFRSIENNATVARAVKDIGLSKIEICRKHADFANPQVHQQVIDTYQQAGVTIQSIGVEPADCPQAELRAKFDFAKAAGLKHVSINFADPGSFLDTHATVQKLAEEYNLRCGIHNHGGHHWLGNNQALGWVYKTAGDRIGLCLDTAWALQAHVDPIELARQAGDRLFAVHMKDFTFHEGTGKHEDVVVGTGNLDLPALARTCEELGFDGEAILEYEGDVDNPIPSLTRCVAAIKAMG